MSNIVVSNSLSSASQEQLSLYVKQQSPKQQISELELSIRNRLTSFQRLTSYSLPTFTSLTSADDIPVKGFNDDLPVVTNPLIQQDRDKAIEKVNNLLAKVNKLKDEYQIRNDSQPLCPYEQTKLEYLGPNFIVPSIHDLPEPTNFSAETSVNAGLLINKQYHHNMVTQLQMMSAEASDLNFTGNLTETLGHAFTMLSTAPNGEQVRVIDRKKTALHLEFAELVRNIPISYIVENPLLVAQKLVTRYIQINKDSLQEQLLTITE